MVPELYNQAYGRWRDEGNDMLQHYSMLGDLADDEYRKYLDDYSHWMADRDYYQQVAGVEYDRGYQDWADQLGNYYADYDRRMNEANNDREYQLALDKFNYQKEQDAQQLALKEAAANASKGTGGGSGSGGGTAAKTPATADAGDKQLFQYNKTTKKGGMNESDFNGYMRSIVASAGNPQAIANRVNAIWDSLSEDQQEQLTALLKKNGYDFG